MATKKNAPVNVAAKSAVAERAADALAIASHAEQALTQVFALIAAYVRTDRQTVELARALYVANVITGVSLTKLDERIAANLPAGSASGLGRARIGQLIAGIKALVNAGIAVPETERLSDELVRVATAAVIAVSGGSRGIKSATMKDLVAETAGDPDEGARIDSLATALEVESESHDIDKSREPKASTAVDTTAGDDVPLSATAIVTMLGRMRDKVIAGEYAPEDLATLQAAIETARGTLEAIAAESVATALESIPV